ncbi:hypothetical protein L5515_011747 [Caenorhabditis briggsae]|uniref:non-specific serine/threonine protein kinase n=1 Tax=Caenorhabditis briggsae TaxID=6238 RepID=A0AAE9JI17_CAEBR|nr:hypothetical protein L5515_011747 [Caenorhabditis briggsae]
MPPKKAGTQKGPKKLTEEQKQRNLFNRRKKESHFCVVNEYHEYSLFASRYDRPEPKFKEKKVPQKKPQQSKRHVFPDVSVEHVSSDEEDAGNFEIPDKVDDEDEQYRKLAAQYNVSEYSSMEVYNEEGFQCEWNGRGRFVKKEAQPPPESRPGPSVETVGNFPMMNKPAKKNEVIATMKKAKKADAQALVSKPVLNFKMSACMTFQLNVAKARKIAEENRRPPEFRVFNTPTRNRILTSRMNNSQYPPQSDRPLMLSYTPPRENLTQDIENIDGSLNFDPKAFSTPIDKEPKTKRRTHRVFNDSYEDEPERYEPEEEVFNEPSEFPEKTNNEKSMEIHHPVQISTFDPTREIEKEEPEKLSSSINRKAETSVTELLEDAEEDNEASKLQPDESKYAKKRQRTASPETMCQGASTLMNTQNDGLDLGLDLMSGVNDKEEEAARVKKRGTLQPQKRQLDRESRCPRQSTMSIGSNNDSIMSAMEEMSLDQKLMDTLGDDLGQSNLTESRAESRNAPTAMTIRHEDESVIPFYLADATVHVEPTTMLQLLHVAGQKEIKTWNDLPQTAFKPRTIKKLGEGSYGEVFATNWDGEKVAIKVVPFEADKNNRLYTGEYHSEQMQPADEILPELIVMKELNQLRDMDGVHSTPNFIKLISAEIVVGEFPSGMLKAWERYAKTVKESENTHPKIYSSEQQKSIVFVSGNGGIALEDFVLKSEEEIFSILHQIIISMMVAEEALSFEHRDLHLGNILIDRNGDQEVLYKFNNEKFALKTHGLKVSIIDFTLSRISKEGTTVYLDLENDPDIFKGEGNPQFDVYRQMRENNGGEWMTFNRRTNLMWIVYIANSLTDDPICPEGLITDERKEELRQYFAELGSFDTCCDSLTTESFFEKFYDGYVGAIIQDSEE